ncbi:glycosyltransferase family 1 protein [Thalassobaculum sp.]|uniref:glycosyltransferase family 4 protein n=1 Tax=Thalassobaculum sp. TaxID=2022740 RepID=UPI0032EA906F
MSGDRAETLIINGRFLAQRQTGVQRAAAELVRALDDLLSAPDGRAVAATILAPPDADLDRLNLRAIAIRRVGHHIGYLWEQWDLPRAARGRVVLNLGNVAPLCHPRNAILIHDASVFDRPDAYSWRFRLAMRLMLPRLARRAAALFTVSAFSAGQLSHHGIANAGGYTVIPNGVEHIARIEPDRDALARHGLAAGRYVLFLGSLHPNKNLAGALAAIERVADPSLRLAVVGAADPRVFGADRTGSGSGGDRVVFLGSVDDAAVAALYAGALALLFPSYYEGFGLPAVEAMALGCPVIASTRASLPEVCGDAAVLVDPDDTAGMAVAIDRLSADSEWRAGLVERGRVRAGAFSWRNSARRLLDALGHAGQRASRSSGC